LRVELRPIDHGRGGQGGRKIGNTRFEHGGDIQVILGLGPVRNRGRLHARKIDQIGDFKTIVRGAQWLRHTAQARQAEKRHLHWPAPIHKTGQRIGLALQHFRTLQKWQGRIKGIRRESDGREKIEIHACAVAQLRGNGGSTVQGEGFRHVDQFTPQTAL